MLGDSAVVILYNCCAQIWDFVWLSRALSLGAVRVFFSDARFFWLGAEGQRRRDGSHMRRTGQMSSHAPISPNSYTQWHIHTNRKKHHDKAEYRQDRCRLSLTSSKMCVIIAGMEYICIHPSDLMLRIVDSQPYRKSVIFQWWTRRCTYLTMQAVRSYRHPL